MSGAAVLGDAGRTLAQSATAGAADPKLLEDLVDANRILTSEGVVDGYGHISVRHDKAPDRYLLSRSLAPELVTADDIVEFDLDSPPIAAPATPTRRPKGPTLQAPWLCTPAISGHPSR